MPIKRREVAPAETNTRWTHTITTPQYVCHVRVVRERIAGIDPQLHSFIGNRYDKVREICSQRGWVLAEIEGRKKK
ncbi:MULTISPECIES: hypothetical protein [unclassified Bradyrhizobium]|uniref:hypothetical protein n=1 Tax=unclassified Bradyrhizobium TaxID=2631580 RepID=UPI003399F19B